MKDKHASQASAEVLAIRALAWLAGNDELFPVFLGSSGIAPDALRSRAAEPEFLASVLDFILMDDAWVLEFSAAAGVPPEALLNARSGLPGGELQQWT